MDSINLEIIIERPSNDDPLGYIGLVVKNNSSELTDEGETYQVLSEGTCSQATLQRVFEGVSRLCGKDEQAFAARVQNASTIRQR